MRALNLYTFTRLLENDLYPVYEKTLSLRKELAKVRSDEIDTIKIMVLNLIHYGAGAQVFDDWFYSFTIPQIGKEFDLLKISKNKIVVNVEIKSQAISKEKIEKQLRQNKSYLSNIADKVYCFSYVREAEKIVLYVYDDTLRKTSIHELIGRILEITNPVTEGIENLFRPKDYLISPLNTPDKFIEGKYYLTNQQEEIKRNILENSNSDRNIWGICGAAGTGKTLLLYDLIKELRNKDRVCVIHCGILSEGHRRLNAELENVSVIAAKDATREILENYSIICVDEAQRLYSTTLDNIIDVLDVHMGSIGIFSYDYAQVLSRTEFNRNNPQRLKEVVGFKEQRLTEKIRTNKELFSFIRTMMDLSDKPQTHISYDNIDIIYANSIGESDRLREIYERKGYQFIAFTRSTYVSSSMDHYMGNINSHHVIGQEFDKVVVILDNNFRYSEDGILQGQEYPNPDYLFPRLFYQNITRAREKLCIIVLDNIEFFRKLLDIKE